MADLKYGEIAGQAYSSPTEKINPSSRTDIKCVFDKLTFAGGDVAKTKEGIWFSDIPRGARILELDVSMSAIFDALNTTVDFEVRIDGSDGSQQVLRTISVEAVLANARSVFDLELPEVDSNGNIISYKLVLGTTTDVDLTCDLAAGTGTIQLLLKYAK